MSNEGVTLVLRASLIVYLIVVGAIFRALVGPGRRCGRIMLLGTLGGLTFGVLVASLYSPLLKADASGLCACLGMTAGWGVSWSFARRVPGEAD